jgi:hypothetical protein
MSKFFFPLILFAGGIAAATPGDSALVHFDTPPTVQVFPDGAVEWQAVLRCHDPMVLEGASIAFSFDWDLDGQPDARDSLSLTPIDCDSGAVHILRTFFPTYPAVLTATLRQGSAILGQTSALAGSLGSLIAIRHFCARPTGGEPEWIDLRNAARVPIGLALMRAQGHALGQIALDPGGDISLGPDSTALQRWLPALPARQVSPWSALRNTGDTLRIVFANGVILDSAVYSAINPEPREACVSGGGQQSSAVGSGFDFRLGASCWNPAQGPLEIDVDTRSTSHYAMMAYDLDGYPVCPVIRDGNGPSQIFWKASVCPQLLERSGPLLLQLQPRDAVPQRKIVMLRQR